jgi:hypothetical protein
VRETFLNAFVVSQLQRRFGFAVKRSLFPPPFDFHFLDLVDFHFFGFLGGFHFFFFFFGGGGAFAIGQATGFCVCCTSTCGLWALGQAASMRLTSTKGFTVTGSRGLQHSDLLEAPDNGRVSPVVGAARARPLGRRAA